jgi:hypothetical protein
MTQKAVAPLSEEQFVDLLIGQVEQEDEPDEGPLFPLRLVQGEDDVVVETSRDGGGWSAEELAMHLVGEP